MRLAEQEKRPCLKPTDTCLNSTALHWTQTIPQCYVDLPNNDNGISRVTHQVCDHMLETAARHGMALRHSRVVPLNIGFLHSLQTSSDLLFVSKNSE